MSYTRYPPQGVRGFAAVHRGSRYGQIKDYAATANDAVAVILQVETPHAIDLIGELAAVPGVDALFVGPGDLAAAMGRVGDVGHAEVQAQIARAAAAANAVGKPIGIVGPNPDAVGRFVRYGYDYVAVASDLSLLTGRAVEWIGAIRGQRPAATPAAAY